MKTVTAPDAEAAAKLAASEIAVHVESNPTCTLGLATGRTMIPVYQELVRRHREDGLSYSRVTVFNLDEYLGLSIEDPFGFRRYVLDRFVRQTDIDERAFNIPASDTPDPDGEASRYEQAISNAGGIDLQLLGVGKNGHIAFNEPGSAPDSVTREVEIAPETIDDNGPCFPDGRETPPRAITMGIGTILAARRIILLATGISKSDAVSAMVTSPPNPDWPCSWLRAHDDCTLIADREAFVAVQSAGGDFGGSDSA